MDKKLQYITVSLWDLTIKKDLTSLVPSTGRHSIATDPVMSSNEQASMDIMYQQSRAWEIYLEWKDTLE